MAGFNRIYRELSIALDGLKKGILEIAIATSENTQVAKLLFRVFELEQKMEKYYIDTGRMVYEFRHLPFDEILNNMAIKDYMSTLKTLQQDIHNIEREINLLREDGIKTKLDDLKRYMRRGGYTIEEFIVDKYSPANGREIRELGLHPGVTVIASVHQEMFTIATDTLRLAEGDKVFILCLRGKMSEVAPLFVSSEQLA